MTQSTKIKITEVSLMKVKLTGQIIGKSEKESADKKKKYYSLVMYQAGDTDVIEINCNDKQYETIKESTTITAEVYVKPVTDNFTKAAKLYVKMAG